MRFVQMRTVGVGVDVVVAGQVVMIAGRVVAIVGMMMMKMIFEHVTFTVHNAVDLHVRLGLALLFGPRAKIVGIQFDVLSYVVAVGDGCGRLYADRDGGRVLVGQNR